MAGGGVEVKVDAKDLSKLYADLKGVEGNLRVELRRGIKSAAAPMVSAAKDASGFSSRIPGSVTVKASFAARGAAVRLEAGGAKAPEAAPLNARGKHGTFRHPAFGNREVWVNQEARPFWGDSIQAHTNDAQTAILRVMDTVAQKAGFK